MFFCTKTKKKKRKELCIIQVYDVFGYPTIQQQR